MKKKFVGIALYPIRLDRTKRPWVCVVVWLPWNISRLQVSWLLDFNDRVCPGGGMIMIRRMMSRIKRSTAVAYVGPICSSKEARSVVIRIAKMVEEATGAHALLKPMPTQRMVREVFFAY